MPKKDFKTVSEMFISAQTPPTVEPAAAPSAPASAVPAGYRLVKEAKTDRLQLLIRPTTNRELQKIAKERGVSKNELINQILEDFVKGAE